MVFDYTHNLYKNKITNNEVKRCEVHISRISFSKIIFSSTSIFHNYITHILYFTQNGVTTLQGNKNEQNVDFITK